MKTRQFFMVLVALVIAVNVFATENGKMSIIPLKDTKALVSASHDTPAVNQVTITSDNGKIMYYNKSSRKMEDFKQIFDLSQLEDGTYEFKLKAGSSAVKRNIDIKDGIVSIQQEKKEIDPCFSFANNIVKVTYLNFENKNVLVQVYNSRKMIFSKDIGDEFRINRAINLSSLETGDYDIMLANNNKEYWFSVTR